MARLRRLSSRQVIRALGRFGFEVESVKGSHAKLARVNESGGREILVVPVHATLPIGTISAIYRQASRFIPPRCRQEAFFSE